MTLSGSGSSSALNPMVTLNSNNKVVNSGTITGANTNYAIGILVNGGYTGSVENAGTISFTDSTSASTDSTTGDTQAPFAPSNSGVEPLGRYGILETGSGTFTGDITTDSGSTISIVGNQSYGIAIEGTMTGTVNNQGTITVRGDDTVGLYTTGTVTGDIMTGGAITATGQHASGIILAGDTTGRFSIYSSVTSSGYGTNTRSSSTTIQADIQAAATEVEQGGAAVVVAGNVGAGIYIAAAPGYTITDSTSDLDGDGVADGSEGTGSVVSYGGQPGLVIGAAGKSITVGALDLTSTSYNSALSGYGLVISGSVSGQGVEDGVSATGIQIGAVTATTTQGIAGEYGAVAASTATGATEASGSTVDITGGIYIGGVNSTSAGSVTAIAYGNGASTADTYAVGIHILGGSTVPTIDIAGSVSASMEQPLVNATTGDAVAYNGSSYGIVIESGATVNSLIVSGSLTAATIGDGANGYTNNATALVDYSGTLSSVALTGSIIASITGTTTTTTPAGSATALDLRYNTSGVSLVMSQAPEIITTAVTSNSVTTTTVTTGATVQNTTGAAETTTTTSGDTTTTTVIPRAPEIIGDVWLGSGTDVVDMEAGTITGNLIIGMNGDATTAAITLENSAAFTGELIAGSNTVFNFNIQNGTFKDTYPEALTASAFHIGNLGVFSFAIDPANSKYTSITVTGAASIDSGGKIGINVLSTFSGTQTYTLLTAAGGLTVANGASVVDTSDVPYLFYATSSATANSLSVSIREKTPAELGMNQAQGAALPAIYQALSLNSTIEDAILGQDTKGSFFKLYNQLLPLYSGGLFRAASQAERTISSLTADPNQIENPTGSKGAWAEQFFVGANIGRGATLPSQAGGFGYAGGVETGGLGFGAVGLTAAFIAINEDNPQLGSDARTSLSQLEVGVYWQGEISGLTLDTRVAAGYDWYGGRRQFVEFNSSNEVTYSAQTKSHWNGYSLVGHAGAAYEIGLGSTWFLRPQLQADYLRLSQDAYTEGSGATGFNLALDSNAGQEGSATVAMVMGAKLGRTIVWRPEFELGVRDVFVGDAGQVSGHFVGETTAFKLDPAQIEGMTGVARIKFKGSSEYYEVGLEAGVEARSRYNEGDAKLSVRVLF